MRCSCYDIVSLWIIGEKVTVEKRCLCYSIEHCIYISLLPCYSPSPSPPAAVLLVSVLLSIVVIVPLVPSITTGANVCPLSVDTLSTDSLDPVIGLVSHHDIYTLFPAATISAFCDRYR